MIDFFSELKADWSWQACRPEDDPLLLPLLLDVHVKTSPLNLEPISFSSPFFSVQFLHFCGHRSLPQNCTFSFYVAMLGILRA